VLRGGIESKDVCAKLHILESDEKEKEEKKSEKGFAW
jgi:hypothetical protein